MKLWLDAQISPHLAPWLRQRFEIDAFSLEYLKLDDAEDEVVFTAAREAGATVITKDEDFLRLQERFGAPPKLIWITCGNTSNTHLRDVLAKTLIDALEALELGDTLVEIRDAL